MPFAKVAPQWVTAGAAVLALLGVTLTLYVNGRRTELQRRRDLHARALAAISDYGEMPYRIRRRAPGAESRAELSDQLSSTKAELDVCQVLLSADGDQKLSAAFDDLYTTARRTVGRQAHDAWQAQPLEHDRDMNMAWLYQELQDFNNARDHFAEHLRTATLSKPRRVARWSRSHLPLLPDAQPRAPQRVELPHDYPKPTLTATSEDSAEPDL